MQALMSTTNMVEFEPPVDVFNRNLIIVTHKTRPYLHGVKKLKYPCLESYLTADAVDPWVEKDPKFL